MNPAVIAAVQEAAACPFCLATYGYQFANGNAGYCEACAADLARAVLAAAVDALPQDEYGIDLDPRVSSDADKLLAALLGPPGE